MVCPNCQSDTNGLKLNNRLYCTDCGFLLSEPKEPEAVDKPIPEKVGGEGDLKPAPKTKNEATKTDDQSRIELAVDPVAKIITPEEEEFAVGPLEAEEEALDLVIDEAKKLEEEGKKAPGRSHLPKTLRIVKKHNRPRTDLKKEGDFVLIPGEPDPIAEPEIEPVEESEQGPVVIEKNETTENHDETEKEIPVKIYEPDHTKMKAGHVENGESMTQENKEKEPEDEKEDYSYLPTGMDSITPKEESKASAEEAETEDVKANPNNDMLLKYFKNQVGDEGPKKKKKKKKSSNKNRRWGLTMAIGLPLVLILGFIGVVLYVNLYAKNPTASLNKAEQRATFNHLKPGYVAPGYATDPYNTQGNATSITYAYVYQPDSAKTYAIKAQKTDLKSDEVRPKIVEQTGKRFVNVSEDSRSIWIIDQNKVYFVSGGVLYTITASSDFSTPELQKIAFGLK